MNPQQSAPMHDWGAPGPFPVTPPSGATAITAAVLSLLGGAAQLFGAFAAIGVAAMLSSASGSVGGALPGWYGAVLTLTTVAGFALGAALFAGGGFLLARKAWAAVVIAAACGVTVVIGILSLIVSNAVYGHMVGEYASGHGFSVVSGIFGLIFPVVTAVLALLPSTRIWCHAGRR